MENKTQHTVQDILTSRSVPSSVGQASNGLEGVQLVDSLQPDVVVMDINMPLMNGFDQDETNDRSLVIRWNFVSGDFIDHHVYLIGGNQEKFLGRTNSGNVNYLEWKTNQPEIAREFKNGPLYNSFYSFRVYGLRIDQAPLVLETKGNVLYLSPDLLTPTITPTPSSTVTYTEIPSPTPTFTLIPTSTPTVAITEPVPNYSNPLTENTLESNNIWTIEGTFAGLQKALVTVTDIVPPAASSFTVSGNTLRVSVKPGEGSLILLGRTPVPAPKKALVRATVWSNNQFPSVITGLIDTDQNGNLSGDGIGMAQLNVSRKISKIWSRITSIHDSQTGYVLPFVQVTGGFGNSDVYIDNIEVYVLDENVNYSGKFLGVQ